MIIAAILILLVLIGLGIYLREVYLPEKMKVRRKLIKQYKRLDGLIVRNDFQFLEWKKTQREITETKEVCVELARQYVGKSRNN